MTIALVVAVAGPATPGPGSASPGAAGEQAPGCWTNPLVPQRADPHIVRHTDGFYYLTASVPEYDRIVLRRATTPAGLATAPETVIWQRHPDGEMSAHIWAPEIHHIEHPEPVLRSNPATSQYGPGHNSFTVSEDGQRDILVYHARPYEDITGDPLYDPNRHARLQPLGWNADGTPHFGVPVADGPLCLESTDATRHLE